MDGCGLPEPTHDTEDLVNTTLVRTLAREAMMDSSRAQRKAYSMIFGRLRKTVTFIVLGGSVLRGNGCSEPNGTSGLDCAYPARFARWMRCMYGSGLQFSNRAIGGTPTSSAIPQIPTLTGLGGSATMAHLFDRASIRRDDPLPKPPDLVLIDWSANDRVDDTPWRRDVANSKVAAATEQILRFLLAQRPSLAILVFEGSCRTSRLSSRFAHERAARHYGVPFLAYGDLIPPKSCFGTRWAATTSSGTHCGHVTHQLLSNVLAIWWRAAVNAVPTDVSPITDTNMRALPAPLTNSALQRQFTICEANSALYDALKSSTIGLSPQPGIRVTKGNWSLFEDVPNKPGWISQGEIGSTIGFDLRFGLAPQASVVFEQGYETFGNAIVRIGNRSATDILHGNRTDRALVTQAQLFTKTMGLRAYSEETLWVETTSEAKVKLRLVSSC